MEFDWCSGCTLLLCFVNGNYLIGIETHNNSPMILKLVSDFANSFVIQERLINTGIVKLFSNLHIHRKSWLAGNADILNPGPAGLVRLAQLWQDQFFG